MGFMSTHCLPKHVVHSGATVPTLTPVAAWWLRPSQTQLASAIPTRLLQLHAEGAGWPAFFSLTVPQIRLGDAH